MSQYPIIESGEIIVDGKSYSYEISELSLNSWNAKAIEVFFQGKLLGGMVKFPERDIEYCVRMIREKKFFD